MKAAIYPGGGKPIVIEDIADDVQVAIARSVDRAAHSLHRRLSRQRKFGPLPPASPEED